MRLKSGVSAIKAALIAAVLVHAEPSPAGLAFFQRMAIKPSTTSPAAPCGPTPVVGQVCPDGSVYVGTYSGSQYFTTPGGCTDSTTPTCTGGTDTVTKSWGNTNFFTEAYSNTDGAGNTAMIIASDPLGEAARFCDNMIYAGQTDWYLPAANENSGYLRGNAVALGGFSDAIRYWSSTENANANAWAHGDGSFYTDFKSQQNLVRCMRRVGPKIGLSPGSLSAFNVASPTTSSSWQTITLTNVGEATSAAVSVTLDSTSAAVFEKGSDNCHGQTLAVGASCTFQIRATGLSANYTYSGSVTVAMAPQSRIYQFSGTSTGFTDPCAGTPAVGTICNGGAIFAGSFDSGKYMIMPGGCDGAVTNPTCSGSDGFSVRFPWRGSSGTSADIAGITNVAAAATASSSSERGGVITPLIISSGTVSTGSPAYYCSDMSALGYTDWVLPSKSELAYIYCKSSAASHSTSNPQESANCAGFGGKTSELKGFANSNYWSGTEVSSTNAWAESFSTGSQSSTAKTGSNYVRCIRRY